MLSTVRMEVILTTRAKVSSKSIPFFYWALYLGGFWHLLILTCTSACFRVPSFLSATPPIHMCGSHARNPSHPAWHATSCGYGCRSLLLRSFPLPLIGQHYVLWIQKPFGGFSLSKRIPPSLVFGNRLLCLFFIRIQFGVLSSSGFRFLFFIFGWFGFYFETGRFFECHLASIG